MTIYAVTLNEYDTCQHEYFRSLVDAEARAMELNQIPPFAAGGRGGGIYLVEEVNVA